MYSEARPKISANETKALGARVATYLRRRYPTKTAASVSADIGIPASTVAKWLEGAATPSLYAGFKLADRYGSDFIAAAWPEKLGFLSEAARAQQLAQADQAVADALAARERLRSTAP